MIVVTTKAVLFLGLGFVLGFLLNGLFHYQDQVMMEKICANKGPMLIFEMYKNCMKRQGESCPGQAGVTAVPAFKNIKMPQQLPEDSKQLASELDHEVNAPRDTTKRYELLSHELAPRKLLLVGVVTAQKYLETRASAVYNTWGKQMDIIFFSEQPSKTQHVNFPVVTLEGVDDHTYPPQRKVFKMLQYMYDKYIDQFDFFMRADDDSYVKKQELYDLLMATNPAQHIFMGSPGFGKPEDRERLKLKEHEHYCMGGPGVILSRALLNKMGPEVDDCLNNVVFSDYDEDVELGRCISHKINIQCTWSYQTRELFFTDYSKGLTTEKLYEMDSVKSAITLHPLKNPIHMYRVHQYILELSANQLHEEAVKNTYELQKTNEMIPVKLQRYQSEAWLGHFTKFQPNSQFEVPIWYYFNSTRLFTDAEGKQAVTLPTDLKFSVNNVALQALISHLNHFSPKGHQYTPPYHLYDGFIVTDFSHGLEYVLRISVHLHGTSDPYRLVGNIFLPFSSPPMVQYKSWSAITGATTVVLIVHMDQHTNCSQFFSLFEKICLKGNLKVNLRVSLSAFNGSDKVIEELSSLRSRYPTKDIFYKLITQTARSYALHRAVPQDQDYLLLFFDPNYILTETFINHCLMNTIANKQVYFPVIFSLYNSDIADQLKIPRKSLVSAETGFWNKYNYRVVCIYQSDYERIGGYDTTMMSGEDVALFEKIRSSPKLQIFRALEPHLVRPFMQRSCQNLPETERVMCLNTVMDTVGSRRQLGLLVLQHKLV